jgi:hypothetical protein
MQSVFISLRYQPLRWTTIDVVSFSLLPSLSPSLLSPFSFPLTLVSSPESVVHHPYRTQLPGVPTAWGLPVLMREDEKKQSPHVATGNHYSSHVKSKSKAIP